MIGGFQVGPFQTNYQQVQATVSTVLDGGGSWEDFVRQKHLRFELRTEERKLKKVEKKIVNAEKRLVQKPDGILMNLHRLEVKRERIRSRIHELRLELKLPVHIVDDEDDTEVLLLDS